MKVCNGCGKELEDDDFSYKNKTKGTRQSVCRTCQADYHREHYQANKQAYISSAIKSKDKVRKFVDDYKESVSCVVCGESDSCCIDFHHLDPSTKEDTIASLRGAGKTNKLKAELEKCVPLCANCHRKVHAGKILLDTVDLGGQ